MDNSISIFHMIYPFLICVFQKMATEVECFFNAKITRCPGKKEKLSKCSRIQKIIEASELRGHHDVHNSLEIGFSSGTVTHVFCHKNCVSNYVSPQNLAHLRQKRKSDSPSKHQPKKLRSKTKGPNFDLKKTLSVLSWCQ